MAIGQVPGQQKDGEDSDESLFSEINITPLTDIFLVLLIIFMVTSSVIVDMAGGSSGATIKVETSNGLPAAASPSEQLTLSIAQAGQLFIDNRGLSYEELPQQLVERKEAMPHLRLLIQPDGATPYRFVLAVIAMVKHAKIPFVIAGK